MTNSQATEYERLNRALAIYRDAMRRHIAEVLDDDPPDVDPANDWYDRKVVARLESQRQRDDARLTRSKHHRGSELWQGKNQLDIPVFLYAVKNPGFRALSDQSMLDRMADIYKMRNRWAHPPLGGFKRAEVERTVNQIAEVLATFDSESADDVRALSHAQMEFVAAEEVVQAMLAIREAVELINAKMLDPNAVNDLVQAVSKIEALEQDFRLLQRELEEERQARERMQSHIAESLRILVAAQQGRSNAKPAQPAEPWLDRLLDESQWRRWMSALQDALRR